MSRGGSAKKVPPTVNQTSGTLHLAWTQHEAEGRDWEVFVLLSVNPVEAEGPFSFEERMKDRIGAGRLAGSLREFQWTECNLPPILRRQIAEAITLAPAVAKVSEAERRRIDEEREAHRRSVEEGPKTEG